MLEAMHFLSYRLATEKCLLHTWNNIFATEFLNNVHARYSSESNTAQSNLNFQRFFQSLIWDPIQIVTGSKYTFSEKIEISIKGGG